MYDMVMTWMYDIIRLSSKPLGRFALPHRFFNPQNVPDLVCVLK